MRLDLAEVPDATTTLSCTPLVVDSNENVTCTVVPKLANVVVETYPSYIQATF